MTARPAGSDTGEDWRQDEEDIPKGARTLGLRGDRMIRREERRGERERE